MKKFWEDFKKFITRGNVVDMAVGVAVAGAFTAIVNAFTKGFITPLLVLISGESSISDLKWVVREAVLDSEGATKIEEVAISYGLLLQAIIDFLIIALTLFIVMRVYSAVSSRAKKLTQGVKEMLTPENEAEIAAAKAKAEAEAQAKAEAEAQAAAEAQAKAEADAKATEQCRKDTELALLTEIRDLLKNKD